MRQAKKDICLGIEHLLTDNIAINSNFIQFRVKSNVDLVQQGNRPWLYKHTRLVNVIINQVESLNADNCLTKHWSNSLCTNAQSPGIFAASGRFRDYIITLLLNYSNISHINYIMSNMKAIVIIYLIISIFCYLCLKI